MSEQLTIPGLFEQRKQTKSPEEDCVEWLCGTHGCTSDVIPFVHRLFAEFPMDAYSRASMLQVLDGKFQQDGWSLMDAELIGLYDVAIADYHVLWDRRWAIVMLVPKELVPKVWRCGYGGRPKFYDRDGNLLFKSIYSVNGKVLTDDERRTALADRDGEQH